MTGDCCITAFFPHWIKLHFLIDYSSQRVSLLRIFLPHTLHHPQGEDIVLLVLLLLQLSLPIQLPIFVLLLFEDSPLLLFVLLTLPQLHLQTLDHIRVSFLRQFSNQLILQQVLHFVLLFLWQDLIGLEELKREHVVLLGQQVLQINFSWAQGI